MSLKAVKKNQSIGKALQIIEVMAVHGGPMRLQDIAGKVSQPPSTTLRFLNTLMDYGYADQNDDTLQYFLTMKFGRIGDLVSRQVKIRDVVRAFLDELSRKFEESVTLAVEQNLNVVYIDVVDGPDHILQALQRVGKIAPLHCTGVGKCLMLDFDEKKINELVRTKGLPAHTKNTIKTKDALLLDLSKARHQGHAEDTEEYESGVRCVAAPLRDYSGKVVAAISLSCPVSRLPQEKLSLVRKELTDAAKEISKRLGHNGGSV